MRTLRPVLIAATVTALAVAPATSQTPVPRVPAQLTIEQQVRERWMHGRQQSRFSPFAFSRTWLSVDSLRADGEMRVWEVVSAIPPTAPRAGLAWIDTIARVSADGPSRQSLRGIRRSRITGDTVAGGRRLWIVRDSAAVQYDESYVEEERTLDTTVRVTRTAKGIVRGIHLYDPEIRLARWREDTTRLAGEAVLTYPDGRSFRTPARYERTRRWDTYDAAAHSARLAELEAGRRREFGGGMVYVPSNELQRRLSSGDAVARDSILREWQRTADPDEGARLFTLLTAWAARSDASRAVLDSIRIAAGDSAHLYQVLANRAYGARRPPDTADVRAMLRFMQDPAIAWGLNVSRDWLYENLAQALTTWPRAASTGSDGSTISCTLAACRMLGEQWRLAREPRLRDVGLVALVSLDPRRWSDTVLALDGSRHPLLHAAALLANGVGATWPAASKAPLPAPRSDWRAWVEWMNGVDPAYASSPAAIAAARLIPGARDLTAKVRFEESHRTAIRFYSARTGRDVVAELRSSYDAAESDSVRFVFATMLQKLGELHLTEAEVADAFTSGVAARLALPRQALVSQFNGNATRVADTVAAPLLDRLISAAVDGAPLWLKLNPDQRGSVVGNLPGVHARVGRVLLNGDSLPDALRAKWGGRVEIISAADWNKRNAREAGVFHTLGVVRSWGRFVQVRFTLSERNARAPGEAPAQNAASSTYYLMRRNGEWVVVVEEGWIT